MSLARSGHAPPPNTVAEAVRHGSQSKPAAADDPPVGGGFLALLASLEPGADALEVAGTCASTDEDAVAVVPAPDFPLSLAQNLPHELALLLAQAGAMADGQGSPPDPQQAIAAGGAGGLPAVAASLAALPGSTSWVSLARPGRTDGADQPALPVAASSALEDTQAGGGKPDLAALLAPTAMLALSVRAKGAQAQAVADASPTELARAIREQAGQVGPAREPGLAGGLVSGGMGAASLPPTGRAAAKFSVTPAGHGMEGLWGSPAWPTGSRVEAPAVMAEPAPPSLEARVADTVNYWVSQGVQKAELTLDGLGGEAVAVSISLKGGEAHIGFRSDQAELRQVLEGATAHLRDLLASEGVVLSGVSVGTSGRGGAGTHEQGHRPGARQATITRLEAVPMPSVPRSLPAAGRAVDLFV